MRLLRRCFPVEVGQRMKYSYERLLQKSLQTQLAYNSGFECMTNGFTNWLIKKRYELFGNSSPHVASFWLMHMVEEVEHKTVAFDAYMAYSGKYWPRAIGLFHGSLHVLMYGIIGMMTAVKKDRKNGIKVSRLSVLKEIWGLACNVGPYLLRALHPKHDPRCETDHKWMRDWIAGHARLEPGQPLPLVDTNNPAMPVPFANN